MRDLASGRPVRRYAARRRPEERVLTVLAVAGVTALTAVGWLLSYTALSQLALSASMPTWAATLWPFCIDLFVFVATLAAIRDRRRARSTTYSWTLSALYSAATVAGNVTAAGADHMAQAVHATPGVTMVLAWHLLSRFLTAGHGSVTQTVPQAGSHASGVSGDARVPKQAARPTVVRTRKGPTLDKVEASMTDYEVAGRRATGDAVAARFGVDAVDGGLQIEPLRSSKGLPSASRTCASRSYSPSTTRTCSSARSRSCR